MEIKTPWISLLEKEYQKDISGPCPSESKLDFIGENIFSFTTYDANVTEEFALQMLEVISHIINRTTFKYIEDEQNYITYLTMVNMPFLVDKLDWGTSIRGAWISPESPTGYYDVHIWKIPNKEIPFFLEQLLIWFKQESQPNLQST